MKTPRLRDILGARSIKRPNEDIREALSAAIFSVLGEEVGMDKIEVQGWRIFVKTDNIIKSEIRMREEEILLSVPNGQIRKKLGRYDIS